MRIVIDLQALQSMSRYRGIGRFSADLSMKLAEIRGDHELFIALNGNFTESIEHIRRDFQNLLPQLNIRVWSAPQPTASRDPENKHRQSQAQLCREAFLAELNPDWLIVASLFEGFEDDAHTSISKNTPYRTAVILHDVIPLVFPDKYLKDDRYKAFYLEKLRQLDQVDLVFVISEHSRDEIAELSPVEPERILNISGAAQNRFKSIEVTEKDFRKLNVIHGIRAPFVMYAGAADERKNIVRLIQAYAALPMTLRSSHQLVLVGHGAELSKSLLVEAGRKAGLNEGELVFCGYVSDDELLLLYNACHLFVFPSLHEGFGLPALEAMKCGKPVIASNRANFPDLLGCDMALFDPLSVPAIAKKMQQALEEPAFREKLVSLLKVQADTFSWESTAQRMLTALEQKQRVKRTANRPHKHSAKLAFVSPLPPERSGIADYSSELISELVNYYSITVVLKDPELLEDDFVRANCTVFSVDEFQVKMREDPFERVIYHFGNSTSHEHMFSLLQEIPGIVVLHDFFYSDILLHMEHNGILPHAWSKALQGSHGYAALAERYSDPDIGNFVAKYPVNLALLQDSLGVIVHSEFQRQLTDYWYGAEASKKIAKIPLLRRNKIDLSGATVRDALGVAEQTILVCSVGILGPTKQNDRLLDAWLESSLADNPNAQLVFVGQANGDYGLSFQRRIDCSTAVNPIKITGWVDASEYDQWLTAADISVQLRAASRGETSASVLDCMNFGSATIVNAHGSNTELDREAVLMLPNDFTTSELGEALEELYADSNRRSSLSSHARTVIDNHHNPKRCAEMYYNSIENFYDQPHPFGGRLLESLAEAPNFNLPALAKVLTRNHPPTPRRKQLFVDVSALVHTDLETGIQRVVRSILEKWNQNPPDGFQIEPVYADAAELGYRYTRRFMCQSMGVPSDWAVDEPANAWPGDIFVGLDLNHEVTVKQESIWQEWRRRGVVVAFVLYDLLPVLQPGHFIDGMFDGHSRWLESITRADKVIAISASVANEYRSWIREHDLRTERPVEIDWFHLGAELDKVDITEPISDKEEGIIASFRKRTSFLMVGTIESRKGHSQVLDAFEALWSSGQEVNLVIVGKHGWKTEKFLERIRVHPEKNVRLFVLESITDSFLEKIYSATSCLISASYGEGFGLPLIEGARHGLPIVCRDIPVFREVAQEFAYYFDAETGADLATALSEWLKLHEDNHAPKSQGISYLTWEESAFQLAQKLIH